MPLTLRPTDTCRGWPSTITPPRRSRTAGATWATSPSLLGLPASLEPSEVSYELVVSYQAALQRYRKADGTPLSVATQVQRLVPVTQFFTWLRREHRMSSEPDGGPLDARRIVNSPRRRSAVPRWLACWQCPRCHDATRTARSGLLEVFYSSALRRSELIALRVGDLDFERGTLFVHRGKGAKDRYVPIGERALFWVRLYIGIVRPSFVADRISRRPVLVLGRDPDLRRLALPQGHGLICAERRSTSEVAAICSATAWPP